MIEVTADTKVREILEYGQGQDDAIAEVFKEFNNFRNGYYGLINYGDEWWEVLNQDCVFDEMMKEQWKEIEQIDFMSVIEKMAKALAGTYVNFSAFADVVVKASADGHGVHRKKEWTENDPD